MTQLPYASALDTPDGAGTHPPRSPSPGPERRLRTASLPVAQAGGSAVGEFGGQSASISGHGTLPGTANGYTTNAMSARGRPSASGWTGQHSAQASRPALPQPAPLHQASAVPPLPNQPHHHDQYSASYPQMQHARPQPVAEPQTPHAAALARHHAELVAYYWHYAQQGLVAPVQTGNEMQLRARSEAVDWARAQGIVVNDPSAPAFAVSRSPSFPPQRQSTAPAVLSHTVHAAQAPTPLPHAPTHAASLRPTPVVAHPSPHHQPPRPTSAGSFASVHRPLPTPSPSSLAATGRPLPSVPSSGSLSRRPLPSPINAAPATLNRSASLASPASPSATSPLTRAATLGGTSPTRQSPIATTFAASPSPIPSLVLESKRPLPTPPGDSSAPLSGRASQSSPLQDQLLQERMAALSTADEPTFRVDSPAPTAAVPSMSFSVPDDEAPAPRPPSPSFAFTLADDDDEPASKPAVPSFSMSGPEDEPSSPLFSISPAPPAPQPAAKHERPRVHPRYDPSHPSHYLYHPTSTAPLPGDPSVDPALVPTAGVRLEAGAIACAGCGQQMYGRALMAMGKEWHPECFKCQEEGCGLLLEHVQFDGREGEGVYCMVHFEEHYAEKCFHCKTPIAESEYINISDPLLLPPTPVRTYHATHFFCANCGDPFIDPSSLAKGKEHTLAKPYIVHKGYAYCEGCDVRLFKPKCARKGCGKGIAADWVEAGGQKYHEDCFRCVDCDKVLSGSYLMRDDGPEAEGEKTYCGECYDIRAKND